MLLGGYKSITYKINSKEGVTIKNNKKRIAIVGHYAIDNDINDGQTVKTRNLYNELINQFNKKDLLLVDTYNWRKNPVHLLFSCIKAIKNCDNIIILPAHNGLRVFVPLFVFLNKFYKKNLIYVVVGGWLADLLNDKMRLIKKLNHFNYIFVETMGLKEKLNDLGLNNVKIMLNFKNIKILSKREISFVYKDKYQLCTFSRVMEQKGISDAIDAISILNKKYKKKIFELDVYGPVESDYKDKFDKLLEENNNYVNYKGVVDSSKSVDVLKQYDLLLFPTRFKTEGLPGTTIDAFSSGLPTIYSDWDYCDEFYKDNYNGIKFKMGDSKDLAKILDAFYNKKYDMKRLKENCLKSAEKYDANNAIKVLIDCLR